MQIWMITPSLQILVRRLPVWHRNAGKRLVKLSAGQRHRPRAAGHPSKEELLSHPVVGQTGERFGTGTLIATAWAGTDAHFYCTACADLKPM